MAQPEFVPAQPEDRVRITEKLPPAMPWVPDRPAEIRQLGQQPSGPQMGVAGPDQGYAYRLAATFRDKLVLVPGEHTEDAVAGCIPVALRRAAIYGRAPVIHDVDLAFRVWGFLEGAPSELVEYRVPRFAGAGQHYSRRRALVDQVPETTLRLKPAEVASRLAADWRALVGA